jgi:energy-coupling factor transport system ATP-binding protein
MLGFIPNRIQLRDVTVDYIGSTSAHPALDKLSLEIAQGSWTAIVGDNGSGKSTLAKILAGISPITEGRITFYDNLKLHMVLQNPETQLIGETILEELTLSLRSRSLTNPADERAYISDLLYHLGLSLPLDTRVKHLSGGQKQLLHIACCLAAGAHTILFDEATSMLDPASRKVVLETTAKLHQSGATILWITHRTEELCFANRVILLDQGRVAYDGPVEDFFYEQSSNGFDSASVCEQYGFEPPYTVSVARALQKLGHALPVRPLFATQLRQAVVSLCPSK